jgi:hypothetical protein
MNNFFGFLTCVCCSWRSLLSVDDRTLWQYLQVRLFKQLFLSSICSSLSFSAFVLAYLNMIRWPASSDDPSTLALVWKYSERHEHDQRVVQAEIAKKVHKLCIIEHSLEDLWKMWRWLRSMLRINVSVKVSFFVKIFITLLAFKYRLYMGMLDGNVRI